MKQKIIVLMIFVLGLNLVSPIMPLVALAASSDNRAELAKYDGYLNAYYENMVEQTTYITAKRNNNLETAEKTIGTIKQYVKDEIGSYENYICGGERVNGSCNNNILEAVGSGLGYVAMTAWTGAEYLLEVLRGTEQKQQNESFDSTYLDGAVRFSGDDPTRFCVQVIRGQGVDYLLAEGVSNDGGIVKGEKFINVNQSMCFGFVIASEFGKSSNFLYPYLNETHGLAIYNLNFSTENGKPRPVYSNNSQRFLALVKYFNVKIKYTTSTEVLPLLDAVPKTSSPAYQEIIKDIPNQNLVNPVIKPQLSCGQQLSDLIYKDGAFYKGNEQLDMPYNGKITINGQECTLQWEKPKIAVNDAGEVIMDDGEKQVDIIDQSDNPSEPAVECDGLFCFLTEIVKSIAGLATKILDGLVSVFVPKDLGFLNKEFEKLTSKLDEKMGALTSIKDVILGSFSKETPNPLVDLTINIPAVGKPISFGDAAFIDAFVPTLKKVISAIVAFITLIYVYRKITGRGGVMEK